MTAILQLGERIDIPRNVAVCPYCQGSLVASVSGCIESDSGKWLADSIDLDCVTEPDIEADNGQWEAWITQHTYMPYVHWLPVDLKVQDWINRNFEVMP